MSGAAMKILTEPARAKVNLTLTVHGRRADGYHELESLVAFADVGDQLTLTLDRPLSFTVTGPLAGAIDGENLIERVVAVLQSREPRLRFGAFVLEKHLPVAAGIGGGSADAAAVLRLVQRANPERIGSIDWLGLASSLGADVPVCLASETAVMRGFGERLTAPLPMPRLHAVMINARGPKVANKTAQVFRALAAGPVRTVVVPALSPPWPQSRAGWLALVASHSNDLERAATAVMPVIETIKAALASQTGSAAIRLSGAGPTCFALYADVESAQMARKAIAARHPDWWVAAATIGPAMA